MRFEPMIAALLVCAACSEPAAAAVSQPIPVRAVSVAAASGEGQDRYSGTLEPVVRVDLAFRVAGYVEALGQVAGSRRVLDRGDRVPAGALLARLRGAEYRQKLDTALAQVAEARAGVRLAADELERARRLFGQGASSQADLDARAARADSTRAQLAAAVARADEARLALRDTELRAPLDAQVLTRGVEVGSLVAAGQPAFTLVDARKVKAVFGAPQSLMDRLRVGAALRIALDDGRVQDAQISQIAPLADALGRVFRVEAELPNPDGRLRPGAVVSVQVPGADSAPRLEVPLSALVRSAQDPRGFAVFVLQGEGGRASARLREVTLGGLLGNAVQVQSGLAAGERVVSVGASLLRDGDAVVVLR